MTKRTLTSIVAVGVAALALAGPHFMSASASLSGSSLNVKFREAGLGNNQTINYVASATAEALYASINGGGKNPRATNKQSVTGLVSASGTFSSDKNGSLTGSLTIAPPGPGSFTAPPGQTLVLVSVSYTNVKITDTKNNVSQSIPGTFAKTFITLR